MIIWNERERDLVSAPSSGESKVGQAPVRMTRSERRDANLINFYIETNSMTYFRSDVIETMRQQVVYTF